MLDEREDNGQKKHTSKGKKNHKQDKRYSLTLDRKKDNKRALRKSERNSKQANKRVLRLAESHGESYVFSVSLSIPGH